MVKMIAGTIPMKIADTNALVEHAPPMNSLASTTKATGWFLILNRVFPKQYLLFFGNNQNTNKFCYSIGLQYITHIFLSIHS